MKIKVQGVVALLLLCLCVLNVAVYLDGDSSTTGPSSTGGSESSSTGSKSSSTGSGYSSTGSESSSTGSQSSSTGSGYSSTGSESSSTGPATTAPTTLAPTKAPAPLPPASSVVVKGKYMFVEATGEQFFFKGINYLPVPGKKSRDADWYTDANKPIWGRDIPILQKLGVNAIRIRFVDPKNSHKGFMNAMAAAGIYVVIDMDPDNQFHQVPPVYDMVLWTKVQGIIDEFSNYRNTLMFIACNEMISQSAGVTIAPYAKALIRDMKRYMNDIMVKGRVIPVTFASLSAKTVEPSYRHIIDYYTCGPEWAAADVAGMNMLWWIPSSTPETSGYTDMWDAMKLYPKPFIFTQFSSVNAIDSSSGQCPCTNRTFDQIKEMLTNGAESLTGGLVSEYSDEQELSPSPQAISNNKGVVTINKGNKVVYKSEYSTLKEKYALAYPPRLNMSTYTPSGATIDCPNDGIWKDIADLPPAPFDASSSTGAASTGSNGSDTGLTKGEIIGIAAGSGAVGLLILASLCRFCAKKRQQADYGLLSESLQ